MKKVQYKKPDCDEICIMPVNVIAQSPPFNATIDQSDYDELDWN
jgi:hypothetical protein